MALHPVRQRAALPPRVGRRRGRGPRLRARAACSARRPPSPSWPTAEELDKAAEIAAAFPRTYAYLALLGDKELLFSEERTAYLMFGVERTKLGGDGRSGGTGGRAAGAGLALPRDVRPARRLDGVLPGRAARACHLYVDLGLALLKIGEEARVPLARFSLEAPRARRCATPTAGLSRRERRFEIVPASGVPALLPELAQISDDWLRAQEHARERLLARLLRRGLPAALSHAPLVRQGDRIVAFANLWPGGDEGRAVGRPHAPPRRRRPTASWTTCSWSSCSGASRRATEWFNLGMAPLSGLESARARAALEPRSARSSIRLGEHFYNFQGLRQYKEKFDPVWEPRYLACPGGSGPRASARPRRRRRARSPAGSAEWCRSSQETSRAHQKQRPPALG